MDRQSPEAVNSLESTNIVGDKLTRIASVLQALPPEAFSSDQAYWLAKLIQDGTGYKSIVLLVADRHITSREELLQEVRQEIKKDKDDAEGGEGKSEN